MRTLEPKGAGKLYDRGSDSDTEITGTNATPSVAEKVKEWDEFCESITVSSWEMQYHSDKVTYQHGTVHKYVNGMHICNSRVIMWNAEERDVTDQCDFCPSYLVKNTKTEYEIMDNYDDVCFVTLLHLLSFRMMTLLIIARSTIYFLTPNTRGSMEMTHLSHPLAVRCIRMWQITWRDCQKG